MPTSANTDCVLIYLHGFLSSPDSVKAQKVKSYLEVHHPDIRLHIPALSFEPDEAIAQVGELIALESRSNVGLVGSSLGGYYSLYCANKFGLATAMINPALKPYLLLEDYLGPNQNMYTGKVYELQKHHMQDLLRYKTLSPSNPESIYILTQTGDETLDYHEALEILPTSPFWIQYGGNHEFSGFEWVVPSIVNFFQRQWAKK